MRLFQLRAVYFALAVSALAVTAASAATPLLLNHQGILTDLSGTPVPDAAYTVHFSIYDAPTMGNLLWTETQSITTSAGLFNTLLGGQTVLSADVFTCDPPVDSLCPRYLEIEVDGNPALEPRVQLVAVPYAGLSTRLSGDVETRRDTILFSDGSFIEGGVPPVAARGIKSNPNGIVNIRGCLQVAPDPNNPPVLVLDPSDVTLNADFKITGQGLQYKPDDADPPVLLLEPSDVTLEQANLNIKGPSVNYHPTVRNEPVLLLEPFSMKLDADDDGVADVNVHDPGTGVQTELNSLVLMDLNQDGQFDVSFTDAGVIINRPFSLDPFVNGNPVASFEQNKVNLDPAGGGAPVVTVEPNGVKCDVDGFGNPNFECSKPAVPPGAAAVTTIRGPLQVDPDYDGVNNIIISTAEDFQVKGLSVQVDPWDNGNPVATFDQNQFTCDPGGTGNPVVTVDPNSFSCDVTGDGSPNFQVIDFGSSDPIIFLNGYVFGTNAEMSSITLSERLLLPIAGSRVGINFSAPTRGLQLPNQDNNDGRPLAFAYDTYSSRRWKENIVPIADALAKIERLTGVEYDLKDGGTHSIGLIAEDVGAVIPEVVQYEENGVDAESIDYARLVALLIEGIKGQQARIRALERRLTEVEESLQPSLP